MTALPSSAPVSGRIASIDIARGVAVFGMFAYHLTWDFASLGFITRTVPFSPGFRLFSHIVASTFLFLAGVSLVLAQRTSFDWRSWASHLAMIVGAALLVTLASIVAFPDGVITFGILHCIALALVVATPFLFLPPVAALVAAVGVAALPTFVQSAAFNTPWLVWLGLNTIDPLTNDYRPFFPWASPVFAGVAIAAFVKERRALSLSVRQPDSVVSRSLAWTGRHTLAIYLVHQPIFFGMLAGIAYVFPPDAENRAFVQFCVARCTTSGGNVDGCKSACACASREMDALDLRGRAVADDLDEAEKLILSRVTQACLRVAR